jgi:N-ethylmaleimide reductase
MDYGQAAKNAIAAGFDGVTLHACNGYLPNQFLAESFNQRTDAYGGSIPNKVRFVLEVMQELIRVVGGEKVGIKIAPFHSYGQIVLDDPAATYTYLIDKLNDIDFAYVEIMRCNQNFPSPEHYAAEDEIELFGSKIRQNVIANASYDKVSAEAELEKGIAKLISFGKLYIANPDLPERSIPAGTITELVGRVEHVGNTSMKVSVEIYVEQMYAEDRELAVHSEFTFVAIDKHKKPVKINQ